MTVTAATDRAPLRLPGDLVIWLLILAELLTFGIFFLTYAFKRIGQVALFNSSQATLDLHSGCINTLLLISSSWAVARSVNAVRRNRTTSATRWLSLALLCGAGFLILKSLEYLAKLRAGIDVSTNDFYLFYFMLTGFHLLHVVVGMVILSILWFFTRRGQYGRDNCHALETGAAFWHLVDLLWIILFPLVYVMR
ncbi:MAG: cytochrome c oxidase subunit 3 family protein [Burkholderiales bacterium]|nr:cytochrome c oxidase subunit 3 family protein [Burkholderiales bacterium]